MKIISNTDVFGTLYTTYWTIFKNDTDAVLYLNFDCSDLVSVSLGATGDVLITLPSSESWIDFHVSNEASTTDTYFEIPAGKDVQLVLSNAIIPSVSLHYPSVVLGFSDSVFEKEIGNSLLTKVADQRAYKTNVALMAMLGVDAATSIAAGAKVSLTDSALTEVGKVVKRKAGGTQNIIG